MITLLGILAACSGNPVLENRLAADPNLQTTPIPENSPNNKQLAANFPAEIPAKKLKRGRRNKNLWPYFGWFYQKQAEKGAAENFQKKFLIFSCDNHV